MDADVLIKNSIVMDGTGAPAVRADVIITGAHIAEIGIFNEAGARRVIDAKGLAVAPGFIDAHTHLDFFLPSPRHPTVMEKWARQGVTTVVAGCCGFSPAPIYDFAKREIASYWDFALPHDGLDFKWNKMSEYLDHLERNGQAFNVAILTGHNTLRTSVVGTQARFAHPNEVDEMKKLLKESIIDGSIGFSVGLFYFPGIFSHTNELVELASVLTEFGAPLVAHTRGLNQTYDKAVEEVIFIAEKNNIPLQLSHHAGGNPLKRKLLGGYDWKAKLFLNFTRLIDYNYLLKLMTEKNIVRTGAVNAINAAVNRGVKIGHDNIPWACGPTTVMSMMPPWLLDGGVDNAVEKLKQQNIRTRVIREIKTFIPEWPNWEHDWWTDNFLTFSARLTGFKTDKNKVFDNMSLKQIARKLKRDPLDTILDLIIEENGKFFMIDGLFDDPAGDDYVAHLLADPNCSIITDIVGVDYEAPNPVPYGAFTKVLGYFAREKKIMSQEEAVRRMTSLPAGQMGLKNRGIIRKGAYADLAVFNPDTINNRATFKNPNLYSEGMEFLFINGKIVIDAGVYHPNVFAGKILRRV